MIPNSSAASRGSTIPDAPDPNTPSKPAATSTPRHDEHLPPPPKSFAHPLLSRLHTTNANSNSPHFIVSTRKADDRGNIGFSDRSPALIASHLQPKSINKSVIPSLSTLKPAGKIISTTRLAPLANDEQPQEYRKRPLSSHSSIQNLSPQPILPAISGDESSTHDQYVLDNGGRSAKVRKPNVGHTNATHMSASSVISSQMPRSFGKDGQDPFGFIENLRTGKGDIKDMGFVYIKPSQKNSLLYNPYDLIVADYLQIDKNDYYTMSNEGVTHYLNGIPDFTPLHQWTREYHLFHSLAKIGFFAKYRIWKAFSTWKKNVRSCKITTSKNALQKKLCLLDPTLYHALLKLRQAALDITSKNLIRTDDTSTYSLEEFSGSQELWMSNEMRASLANFESVARSLVEEACQTSLNRGGFKVNVNQSSNNSNNMKTEGETGILENEGQEMTFTQRAAKKAECRRLQKFVKLADYLIVNALQMLTLDSMRYMLQLVLNKCPDNIVTILPDQEESLVNISTSDLLLLGFEAFGPVIGKAPTKSKHEILDNSVHHSARSSTIDTMKQSLAVGSTLAHRKPPLFRLQLLISDENRLTLQPSASDFVTTIDGLVQKILLTIENVKLLTSTVGFLKTNERNEELELKNGPELSSIILSGSYFRTLAVHIKGTLIGNYLVAEKFSSEFERFKKMYLENCEMDISQVDASERQSEFTLEFFEVYMAKFSQQRKLMEEMKELTTLNNLLVDTRQFKRLLLPSPQRCFDEIAKILPGIAREKNDALLNELNYSVKILKSTPQNVEAFVEYLNHLEQVKERKERYETQHNEINRFYEIIHKYHVSITPTELAMFQTLNPTMRQLKDAIELADETREESITRFSGELEKDMAELVRVVLEIKSKAQDPILLNPTTKVEIALEYLDELHVQMSACTKTAGEFENYQNIFKQQQSRNPEVEEVITDLALKRTLWASFLEWEKLAGKWNTIPFEQLNTEEMNTHITTYLKAIYTLEKGLPPNEVVPKLKNTVDTYRTIYNTIVDLRNPALKTRHWDRIQDAVGIQLVRDDSLTLETLKEAKIFRYKEEIQSISSQATTEAALEDMLSKVVKVWAELEFVVLPYRDSKDVFILGGIDELQTQLEDSQMTISTLKASRFIGPIKTEVEKWDRQLALLANTLEAWMACQRSWLYLEAVFSAPDIQRQLPEESKMFSQVDRAWKDIMRKVNRNPNALKSGTAPGVLEALEQNNELLEKIQRCLEDYLESKRLLFPRFYFLSNDELLEILSQTKNPQAVQPHLSKCFDAIKTLDFSPEPRSIDIQAMISPEGERIPFAKSLKARGNVEAWLSAVEDSMFATVRKYLKTALAEYDGKNRTAWLLSHCGQVTLTASQIMWSKEVTECLSQPQPTEALKLFKNKCIANLAQVAAIVRGDLTRLQRAILGALITIDVHGRDIVIGLLNAKTSSPLDFEWNKQLRYYWDSENDSCQVRVSNTSFAYGYEYLGCSPRLVITPLTDRCYLTLTGALAMNLGGSPVGPAGTGKTETVKDLAKALARQCVVFNCSDSLDYKMMGKFFAGLAQSGAWCCFDEFNRIDIEVLSVIAQQLLTVKAAKDAKAQRFMFEGRDIRLIDTCAAFITMNPGYAGRTELPDNLKALFRPIAMMIPDYGLIAEIMLFSEGFEGAKMLAGKVVNLYKLCSEQLSQQDHYDFGMRAVKSVLVMAGALKRANSGISEDIVLIRSLRDSNLPKFLAEDIPLFLGILQDLFPGVIIPNQDYGVLKTSIEHVLQSKDLMAVPTFVDRIIQLYDITRVRHGVMLVGPTGGGKTVAYQTLAEALTRLRASNHKHQDYQKVQTSVLNPKCITMAELYGEFNLATMEWRDGLMGNITRQQVSDVTSDEKWTIFDGPVDALWIENMNTVLDDNKLLCLSNGERIKLNPSIRMLFEVADLAVASPATVSRCGMVYMDPTNLGWRPYVTKWIKNLPQHITDGLKTLIFALFEDYVDSGLRFVRKECKEQVPSVDINLVQSLCRLLRTFLVKKEQIDFNISTAAIQPLLAHIFIFCYTWSIGGNITDSSRDAFDTFAKALFSNGQTVDAPIPTSNTVYAFLVDLRHKTFVPWEEKVPQFQYSPEVPYFQIMVPTVDTIRYQYLLSHLLEANHPTLLIGSSGVGKSVIIQDLLNQISTQRQYINVNLNFSAQTSSAMTQQYFELKLEKKRKNILGAPQGTRVVLFVDDLNMPKLDTYGAQPAIELLRQYCDFGGFYDREQLFWKFIEDVTLVSACAPPGGGRNNITPRLLRHYSMLSVPTPADGSLSQIFRAIVDGFFKRFPSEVRACTEAIVTSSIELFNRMCSELLPTPAKTHYTFNLRDLSKVIQGMIQVVPTVIQGKIDLARLFCHESARVFHDRLIDERDRLYFNILLADLVETNFGVVIGKETLSENPIMFGDFLKRGIPKEERLYVELTDMKALNTALEDYLEEYNVMLSKDARLIFFLDAKQHISRILRILRQPRSNALLVGVGGCGKKSLTRLACHIADFKCYEIELTRTYGNMEWREDIKRLYRSAGVEGKNTVFLLSDTQIKSETFLEDINSILNSGDVPNLFDVDEREQILGELRQHAREKGISETRDSVYQFFINRVQDNLHIVFATSPVGDTFRNRCRVFPSLVNCCVINWFDEWPREALLAVSRRFLEFVDLGSDDMKVKISEMCVEVHTSVNNMSKRYYAELRRRYYTTPTSYLELINLYVSMLQEKRKELGGSRSRLNNGLQKLAETNELVVKMQAELEQLGPELKLKAADVETLMAKISNDQAVADGVKKVVADEEAVVKETASQTEAIARDAQKDLDEALPALDAAYKALDSLDKKDISEMKAFTKPPELVQTVMEAICILMKVKPDWESSKKLLGDPQFLKKIQEFDKDNIPEGVIKKLKKYIENPNFNPEAVEKVSKAAKSMCMWVIAMDIYSRVLKEVQPKRQRLEEAQQTLEITRAKLAEKQLQLKNVEEQLLKLKLTYEESLTSKKFLVDKMEETSCRLQRASKLTTALADEQTRWTASVQIMNKQIDDLVGNIFLAAACIAYYGAFSSIYRRDLVSEWIKSCQVIGIPVSTEYALADHLADPVKVRDWNLQGLPADNHSTENGILVTRGRRWPLMIDPQGQANRWIRSMEGSDLKVIKLSEPRFLRLIENAIRTGTPVLLEDVPEQLDPALEPLLLKQTVRQGGRLLMKLGDTMVEYDKNFRLYITTKLANPHYMPEVCIKVTIINFTVTKIGLEGQLLADVVKLERPELENQRNDLIMSISNDKRQLKAIEEKILKFLYSSQGNILDDQELIDALNQSKSTSTAITERVKQAETTEKQINLAREGYRPVAIRGSIIFFVIADLAEIDPMYQFSLKYFKNLFNQCIIGCPKNNDLNAHVARLSYDLTFSIFGNVSRALFEQHKLIFAFIICVEIMRDRGDISEDEWNFFLRGAAMIKGMPPRPPLRWLSDGMWQNCCSLSYSVPVFSYLTESISMNATDWENYVESDHPYLDPIPALQKEKTTPFSKLLVVKVLREEMLVPSVIDFIKQNLGPAYVDMPPLDLAKVMTDTNSQTPLIFILSVGSDPVSGLLKLAETMNYANRIQMVSLGQGQGPIAENVLSKAAVTGDWVFLQNCHLAASWMPKLEQIVKAYSSKEIETHAHFRLFLSSMPSKVFPISVLQESVKVTNEPPKGVKANIARSFSDIPASLFDHSPPQGIIFKKLVFGLCFFNAVIHERKKFGPLGWNITYDWSNSDLDVSIKILRNFLAEQDGVSWEALQYLTGEIAFGGRVTDDWDRRTIRTILAKYYTPSILDDKYKFSTSLVYYAPPDGDLASFKNYIDGLPFTEEPAIFGMHENANISYQMQESRRLVRTIIDVQPRLVSSKSGKSSEENVAEVATAILEEWPILKQINLHTVKKSEDGIAKDPAVTESLFEMDSNGRMKNSLSTVLYQESVRFNRLLLTVKESLANLLKAIKGQILMSADLEKVFNSLMDNQVPQVWATYAYPSLKPLASWVKDLHRRVAFMNDWISHGQPKSFWLPGFFFPQGFLTGVFQNYARRYNTPIDMLNFAFEIQKEYQIEDYSSTTEQSQEDGVLVRGLYIEGARWDVEKNLLQDSFPMEMVSEMPLIRFIPKIAYQPEATLYVSPLYKTSARAGTLSTTGHSTNFVVSIHLPSDRPSEYWITRGVALLMQHNE